MKEFGPDYYNITEMLTEEELLIETKYILDVDNIKKNLHLVESLYLSYKIKDYIFWKICW